MGEIDGLPAHVLLVHGVVVGVPVAALALVLAAVWPAARARLGPLPLLLALGLLGLVPVTASAGEWLEERVPQTQRVREHADMGESLLPWVIGLAGVAALLWWLDGASGRRRTGLGALRLEQRRTRIAIGVLAAVVAVGALVTVYRIGDSGARAAWEGRVAVQD